MLFEDHAHRDGFRLETLEVFNWGTFNRHVWTLELHSGTALLTGENGSGKSTLVDALLTLLVPGRVRHYNQASGASGKRERDEKSYVLGAYKRTTNTEDSAGNTRYLRVKDTYSVLLARFVNTDLQQTVTLAQVFSWGQDNELKKFHVVASQALSIKEHFTIHTGVDELRKRLRGLEAGVYDEFSKYSRDFLKRFSLRSDKALDLFNQTVSIKEIGGLNDFVRQHMLEKTNAIDQITALRENYENLTRAHDAILKAQQQIARLEPLLVQVQTHAQLQTRIAETEASAEATAFFFASRKLGLLEHALNAALSELSATQSNRDGTASRLKHLRDDEFNLRDMLRRDGVGQQLESLQRELEYIRDRLNAKQQAALRYDQVARQVKMPPFRDKIGFHETARRLPNELDACETKLEELTPKRDALILDQDRLEAEFTRSRQELESLERRTSQIPLEDIRIREDMTQALGVPEDELPFIGELLRVRLDARSWEPAIERLLRGYARQLLVPDTHYRQVSGHVNNVNLRGRLVYHRIPDRLATTRRISTTANLFAPNSLVDKLEVKPDNPMRNWVIADLEDRWNYVCCESLEAFAREPKAITLAGQVRHNQTRHEKDDRSSLGNRAQYVLGWDNRDKVQALQDQLAELGQNIAGVQQKLADIKGEQGVVETRRNTLRKLLEFESYSDLDWHSEERRSQELEAQRQMLEAKAENVQRIQRQLEQCQMEVETVSGTQKRLDSDIGRLEDRISNFEQQQQATQALLESVPIGANKHNQRIEAELGERDVTLETLETLRSEIERRLNNSANTLRGQAGKLTEGIVVKMNDFRREYPGDTTEMDANIEAAPEYQRMLERLSNDDLPSHQQRFKTWMEGKATDSIVGFQGILETQEKEIRASIATLNESLYQIDYTPATYIHLQAKRSGDTEIMEFRQLLRACIPDVGRRTPEANEQGFLRIRTLIARFETEDRWTSKVTDVRNWLEFAAEERYREDDTQKAYYSDSSGKSGGQKAKLAYTILASAIAYQYGLDQDGQRSKAFRFVVIDEAFSKSDEQNARYAMRLFEQLRLQLLVVTPLDKSHVVEPFITSCHFVNNTREEDNSRVFNLTIEEYRRRKSGFQVGDDPAQRDQPEENQIEDALAEENQAGNDPAGHQG
jgi:uncharacterized protein YPO0396